jgi:hypothetical protein
MKLRQLQVENDVSTLIIDNVLALALFEHERTVLITKLAIHIAELAELREMLGSPTLKLNYFNTTAGKFYRYTFYNRNRIKLQII